MSDWVCLIINPTYYRRGKSLLDAELRKIFSDDLDEIRVVFGEEKKDVEEYYAFVRCSNYDNHVIEVRRSSAIRSVLPSYDAPAYLSDAEVNEFMSSIEEKNVSEYLLVGDVVKVKNGYLSGLTGLVIGESGSRDYDILFRFHTRKFEERISITNLSRTESIFENIKVPVLTDSLMESGILWACATGIQFCRDGI